MATTETVTLKLNLDDGQSMKSLRDLRKEMKSIDDLMSAAGASGNVQVYEELKKKYIELKEEAKDLREELQPMEVHVKTLTGAMGGLTQVGAGLATVFGADSKSAEELFKTFAKAQALGQVVNGFNQLIADLPKVAVALKAVGAAMKSAMATNPIMLVVAAVAALAAGVMYLISKEEKYNRVKKKTKEIDASILKIKEDTAKGMATELSRLSILMSKYSDVNTSQKERKTIIKELNTNYSDLIGYTIKEDTALKDLKKSYDDIIKVLYKKYQTQALEGELTKLFERRTKLQIQLNQLEAGSITNMSKYNSLIEERDKLQSENDAKNLPRILALQQQIDAMSKLSTENSSAIALTKTYKDELAVLDSQIQSLTTTFSNYLVVLDDGNKETEEQLSKTLTAEQQLAKQREIIEAKEMFQKEEDRYKLARRLLKIEYDYEQLSLDNQKAGQEAKDLAYRQYVLDRQKLLQEERSYETDLVTKQEEQTKKEEEDRAKEREEKLKKVEEENEAYIESEISMWKTIEAIRKKAFEDEIKLFQARMQLMDSAGKSLQSFGNILGEETRSGAIAQRAGAMSSIVANTAIGISEAVKDAAVIGITPVEKAAIIAAGIAQVFAGIAQAKEVLSQPLPTFATGGVVPGYGDKDNQMALLTPGEFVINKSASKSFAPILNAINSAGLGGTQTDIIDYDKLAHKLAMAINSQEVYVVSHKITKRQTKDAKIRNRARF